LEETPFGELYKEEVRKTLLDNLNVLYVALTRPEDRLYVISSTSPQKQIANWFTEFLKATGVWENEEKIYSFGNKILKTQKLLADDNLHYTLKECISLSPYDRIRITRSFRHGKFGESSSIKFGNLLHDALSLINTKNQTEEVIGKMNARGLITAEESEELNNKINALLNHPIAGSWFKDGLRVKTEKEILQPDGSIYRPDRIIINENEVLVIDFKTGKKRENPHIKQLEEYAESLHNMGYRNIKKYLYYTEEAEVVEI
jgi:ATP-dependent exoDNAse (exonuclease V) beta subunit